jgi:hypothetical protein
VSLLVTRGRGLDTARICLTRGGHPIGEIFGLQTHAGTESRAQPAPLVLVRRR